MLVTNLQLDTRFPKASVTERESYPQRYIPNEYIFQVGGTLFRARMATTDGGLALLYTRLPRSHQYSAAEPSSIQIHYFSLGNDPSAGSPTETLLRLLLPLDNVVRSNFQSKSTREGTFTSVLRPH
jgi:hypothetical protein